MVKLHRIHSRLTAYSDMMYNSYGGVAGHSNCSVLGNRDAMREHHSLLVTAKMQTKRLVTAVSEGKRSLCVVDSENQSPIVKDR